MLCLHQRYSFPSVALTCCLCMSDWTELPLRHINRIPDSATRFPSSYLTMSTQRLDDHLPRERDALHDDPLLPQTPLQQAPPPTRGCASLFRIVDIILSSFASIVVGQLFLSAAAWAFVGYLAYHKQLPLGDFAVDIISQHHSETTLLVTLIATAISALSTFLFTKAVGRALTTRLCRPLSVGDLRTGIELSKGSFVLNWEWCSMATILCVVILNTLTAA
ncbi:hypothetical protein PAXINDRAFT_104127 [Paxillus involutus ATCC 200175]|uniref:Uncharacterized protein n=1 Tax=Paxillus involutus ATCC 200175 TaxID=664439 RepID=A0A0C9SSF3_PAXIN|nr:hypothetical protein PAXINDRAFT_104127 [Paxillus involutus ATCC 200175]